MVLIAIRDSGCEMYWKKRETTRLSVFSRVPGPGFSDVTARARHAQGRNTGCIIQRTATGKFDHKFFFPQLLDSLPTITPNTYVGGST